jgi:hypothetical protein
MTQKRDIFGKISENNKQIKGYNYCPLPSLMISRIENKP